MTLKTILAGAALAAAALNAFAWTQADADAAADMFMGKRPIPEHLKSKPKAVAPSGPTSGEELRQGRILLGQQAKACTDSILAQPIGREDPNTDACQKMDKLHRFVLETTGYKGRIYTIAEFHRMAFAESRRIGDAENAFLDQRMAELYAKYGR